jgi:hypothetical protein
MKEPIRLKNATFIQSSLESRWCQFLGNCRSYENVSIFCSDGVYKSHRLLLTHLPFMKYLLLQEDDSCEDSVILLPDFRMEQVQKAFNPILNDPQHLNHGNESLNQLINFNIRVAGRGGDRSNVFPASTEEYNKARYGDVKVKDTEIEHMESTIENPVKKDSRNQMKIIKKKKMKSHKGFRCEFCAKHYSEQKYLDSHISKIHPEHSYLSKYIVTKEAGLWECKLCMKEFRIKRRLRYHLKFKHKIGAKFQCDTCDKIFFYDYELELHR